MNNNVLFIYELLKHQYAEGGTVVSVLSLVCRYFKRSGPVLTKVYQNQDQDQAEVKKYFTMHFVKPYYNYSTIDCWYLTIDCWHLIKYVLQTRHFVILSFLMKEKVIFIVATVMKI